MINDDWTQRFDTLYGGRVAGIRELAVCRQPSAISLPNLMAFSCLRQADEPDRWAFALHPQAPLGFPSASPR